MQPAPSLRSLYFLRAAIAYIWVAGVALTAPHASSASALLLAAYAAWDAIANFIDIRRSPPGADVSGQRLNIAVSAIAALVMASGAHFGFNVSVITFGLWALGAGVLQLVVGLRRKASVKGQWLMIASGGQSALAGAFFIRMGLTAAPAITDLVGYAAFGATYFLVSALWLTFKGAPRALATA